jgi:hypothetical protein
VVYGLQGNLFSPELLSQPNGRALQRVHQTRSLLSDLYRNLDNHTSDKDSVVSFHCVTALENLEAVSQEKLVREINGDEMDEGTQNASDLVSNLRTVVSQYKKKANPALIHIVEDK